MRRTGVIVGFSDDVDAAKAEDMLGYLEQRFPGVVFAIASYTSSIAFEYDDPKDHT